MGKIPGRKKVGGEYSWWGIFRGGINRGGTFRGEFSGGEIAGHLQLSLCNTYTNGLSEKLPAAFEKLPALTAAYYEDVYNSVCSEIYER